MFRKPFTIKSNNQLKGSDRKSIKELFLKEFPTISEGEFEQIILKKETVHVVKLLTGSGCGFASNKPVQVYLIDQRPMFFIYRDILFPTVFMLWKYPNLVPSFTTHNAVLMQYISSGADFMLPGVVTPPAHSGLSKYGNLERNQVALLNSTINSAAQAVGLTAQSSADMLSSGNKGKCLIIYHTLGDELCYLKSGAGASISPTLQIPHFGAPHWLDFTSYDQDFPELRQKQLPTTTFTISSSTTTTTTTFTTDVPNNPQSEQKEQNENNQQIEENDTNQNENESTPSESMIVQEMDDLFLYCFLVAVKYSKTLTLPVLTSNFYKLHMVTACPEGKRLDVKKTSFKKLKPFLNLLAKEGVITVQEIKKGVESIIGINYDHPKITTFYVDQKFRPKKPEDESEITKSATQVMESYIITQNVLPIFSNCGFRKGDMVQMNEIRKCVTEYVKKFECQNLENKKYVQPKEHLVKICKTESNVTWEELMEKTCELMKNCFVVSSETERILNKGKVAPINITVSVRSCSKKVTLVENLESFGIRLHDFAKECQHGVAASTSINKIPGKNSEQLLIQGNQVIFVHNLLKDKYKIPIKYIRGLEYAPKKKR